MLVAIVPIAAARERDLALAIRTGGRASTAGLGSLRRPSTQQVLIVGEIALAMTLLTAGGLMARSLQRQLEVRVGFNPDGVTAARLTLPTARYLAEQRPIFVARLEQELRRQPLVADVAIGSDLPFGSTSASSLTPDGDPERVIRHYHHYVTPEYFKTLSMPLLRGRQFTVDDREGRPLVAIVSQSGARRIWKGDDVVGRRIRLGTAQNVPVAEIIGVVADARFRSLVRDIAAPGAEPDVFFPFAQRTDADLEIAVRSSDGSPISIASLQAAVSAVDPAIPIYRVERLLDAVAEQTATPTFGAMLLAVFSGGTLLLAAIGLYGLVAYVVGLSRREIAVRLALGATPRTVARLIVANSLALVIVGVLIGVAGAVVAGRSLEAQLFETRATDPGIYALVALIAGRRDVLRQRVAGAESSAARSPRGLARRLSGAFLFVLVLVELVAPRARLGTGDDAGDVRIFSAAGATGCIGATNFVLLAAADLFLLAFLPRALARPLLLRDFWPARHSVLLICERAGPVHQKRRSKPAQAIGGIGRRLSSPPA